MYMSLDMTGDQGVDYSDFEYQLVSVEHKHEEGDLSGGNALSAIQTYFDPMEGRGGLANNEVAELVAMFVDVSITHDQNSDDQDVGSETQFIGVLGANLPAKRDVLPGAPGTTDESFEEIFTTTSVSGPSNDGGESRVENAIFAPFRVHKTPAFDDQSNGAGGAGGHTTQKIERAFRQLTGRGPVLDSNDEITVVTQLGQDDETIGAQGNVDIHMVWDIAEVSDAGREFSVPF